MSVITRRDAEVVTIELPSGSWTTAVARDLESTLSSFVEDRDLRVVVLVASDDFCTGASDALDRAAADPVAALARLRMPVVGVVRGACRSVGLELLLATDVRIAADNASFEMPDVVAGQLPMWGGTQRLPRAIGHAQATWMLMTGSEVDAGVALSWGLIHEVVADPDAALAKVLTELAATGPLALEFAKEAVHRGSELPLRDGLRLEGDLNHQLAATEDRAEGLAAFFDKRPPDFSGR